MGILVMILVSSFVSGGVGIKWDRESALAEGGEKACLTYGVYNPWPEETYVKIGVSEELIDVLDVQDINATLVPAHTSSGEAIPVEFCFEVPKKIYKKNCWLGSFFVCEQQCKEEQMVYGHVRFHLYRKNKFYCTNHCLFCLQRLTNYC